MTRTIKTPAHLVVENQVIRVEGYDFRIVGIDREAFEDIGYLEFITTRQTHFLFATNQMLDVVDESSYTPLPFD